jgi:hypothetical protein
LISIPLELSLKSNLPQQHSISLPDKWAADSGLIEETDMVDG